MRAENYRGQKRGEIARARMLDAGLDVFAGLTLDDLLGEVGPRRVVRELGDVSAGGFYHHFPDRAAYLAALVEHGLGPRAGHVAPATSEFLRRLVQEPDPDVVAMIEQASRDDFEGQTTRGLLGLRLRLCVWAAHDDPAVRETLRRCYERSTAQYVAAYQHVLECWGREFRPPFTPESVAVVFTALLEGLAVRACIDPPAADAALFGQAVRALLPVVTRAEGEPETLDDVVASMREPDPPALVAPDVALPKPVLDAVLARADTGALDDASIDDIARDAGVEPNRVYQQFLTKPGLAAATFARFLPLLARPVTRDLDEGRPPLDVIREHLRRLADTAVRHRDLTAAFLEAVQTAMIRYGDRIGPSDPRAVVPLSQILEPAVQAGQEQGTVRDDHAAVELAAAATDLLLLRVIMRPKEPADRVAAFAGDVTLFGLVGPADEE